MMENGIWAGEQFEEKCKVRRVFGTNLHDCNLSSVIIVWVGGRGVEVEARKVIWKHIVGKNLRAHGELWLYCPCSEEGLRAFE